MNTSTLVACALSSLLASVGCSSGGGCPDVDCTNGARLQVNVPVGTDYRIEACVDDVCTTKANPLYIMFQGDLITVEISALGGTADVWFNIDHALPDGVSLHVNVYDATTRKIVGEHTDPITWSHPEATACGGSCVSPTNLVVHTDP